MTDDAPQGSPAKQLSPAFNTGSGGARFENQVQAAFALLMLSGGSCPILRYPIKKLILQARNAGYHTDDIVVLAEDRRGNKARLLAQIKHNPVFTQGNGEFAEVVAAAWRDYSARIHFDPATDVIALITGPLSGADIDDVRPILRHARQSSTSEDFMRKMSLAQFTSNGQRTKLAAFRTHLDAAKGVPVTDSELWGFLSRFHVMGYDFDEEAGTSLSLLESHLSQFRADGFSFVWTRIADVVGAANQSAGELTPDGDNIPKEVKDVFKRAPVEIPPELLRAAVEAAQAAPPPLAGDQANALMVAALLGSWNEKKGGDMDAAKKLIE